MDRELIETSVWVLSGPSSKYRFLSDGFVTNQV